MNVYVDESGSPGVRQGQGATDFFTIAIILFETEHAATDASQRIAKLRRDLRVPASFEFHFNDAKARNRAAFLQVIAPVDFSYFAATIDKAKRPAIVSANPSEFYRHACGLAFAGAEPFLVDATVTIDATGGRVFRQTLRTHLLRLANGQKGSKTVRKILFEDSAANSLIQMADIVSGAIRRSYSDKPDAKTHRKTIAHRELESRLWP